jgi:Xaa-Pro aminopeptidase
LLGALLALKKMHVRRAGLEAKYLSHEAWRAQALKAGKELSLANASEFVEELRLCKDEDEISCIKKAAALGDELFKVALRHVKPGVVEVKVAAEIEYAARRKGAEGMAFATIVAGGTRSALPHGVASQQRLPEKGFVVLDFGVILSGYCSDMTRTMHIGKPDARARSLYEAVREAQESARRSVRPGIHAGAVDKKARTLLQQRGYGNYFTHSTGHGLGLEIHEAPRLGKGNKQRLQAGMVLTIEPGAYMPGCGGVRIEDMVLVTQNGCETLTSSTRELITV